MSKRLMPTYLIKFLENLYNGNKPLDFTRVMVTRQFIAKLKELYEDLGSKQPENYTQILVPKYLQDFFNELEILEFDDDDISQTKTIPSNLVYPACRIDSIGGMSYKSENLIYAADKPEGTTQGVTYSITDGVVTLNGTSTGVFTIDLTLLQTIPANTPVTLLLGGPSNAPIRIYFFNDDTYVEYYSLNTSDKIVKFTKTTQINRCYINIQSGGVFNNQIFKPMLVLGTYDSLDFVPGYLGIRDSAVTAVKSYGANVFNFNENVVSVATSTSPHSINLTLDTTNKTISAKTTASYSRAIVKLADYLIPGKTYTISFNLTTSANMTRIGLSNTGTHVDNREYGYWDTPVTSGFKSKTFTATNNLLFIIPYLCTSPDNNCEMTISDIMLNEGSTALPYTPYKGLLDTYTIPSEIQALEGYGQGINSTVYNNVDFASGKYTKKVGVIDLGTLTYNHFEVSGLGHLFRASVPTMAYNNTTNLLCAKYATVLSTDRANGKIYKTQAGSAQIDIIDNSYNDADAFKTAMNGILLYFDLVNPTETNITETAPLLEVEEGGKVVFENEYNNDVPSEVVTWIKES